MLARTLPKLSGMALALASLLVARRPAAALLFVNPSGVQGAMFNALGEIFLRVASSQCLVEMRFGLGQLQDAIPLLYHLCDFKTTTAMSVEPPFSDLPAAVSSLVIDLVYQLVADSGPSDNKTLNTPLPNLCLVLPELQTAGTRVSRCYGDCALLHELPGSFTICCLVEMLGRWASRGIPVAESRGPAVPLPELAAKMSPRELREYTETTQQAFKEYEERFNALIRGVPALSFAKPIWEAIARGAKPAQPSREDSLLRGPLHAHMKCALPGCNRTTARERGGPLKLCGGSCGGLARYCSETHFREHWPQHKHFCSR